MNLSLIIQIAALSAGLAGCSKNPGIEISSWDVRQDRAESRLERRPESNGKVAGGPIELSDEEWKRGDRFLYVMCKIQPAQVWRPVADGQFELQLSKFRLLVPGGKSVSARALSYHDGNSAVAWSEAASQRSKSGKESYFNAFFVVGPEIFKQSDLTMQYGELLPQPLSEKTRFHPILGQSKTGN